MYNNYFRVTYNGIGIYEALKKQIWNDNSDFSKEEWECFIKSSLVNWLKKPSVYENNHVSFFTELGFDLFMKNTYPLFLKWLDEKKICIEKIHFEDKEIKVVYSDEYQIVIEGDL